MRKSGRPVHPDDEAPPLEWEGAAWWLYLRVSTQLRVAGMGAVIGLDYNPAIAIIRALRWDLPLALVLLQAIERQLLASYKVPE